MRIQLSTNLLTDTILNNSYLSHGALLLNHWLKLFSLSIKQPIFRDAVNSDMLLGSVDLSLPNL